MTRGQTSPPAAPAPSAGDDKPRDGAPAGGTAAKGAAGRGKGQKGASAIEPAQNEAKIASNEALEAQDAADEAKAKLDYVMAIGQGKLRAQPPTLKRPRRNRKRRRKKMTPKGHTKRRKRPYRTERRTC